MASSITYRRLKFYTQAKAIIYSKRCQYISALPLFYYVECPRIDISVFKIEFQQQCVPRTLVLKDQVIKARRCPVCVIPYHSLTQVVTVHGFGLQNLWSFAFYCCVGGTADRGTSTGKVQGKNHMVLHCKTYGFLPSTFVWAVRRAGGQEWEK